MVSGPVSCTTPLPQVSVATVTNRLRPRGIAAPVLAWILTLSLMVVALAGGSAFATPGNSSRLAQVDSLPAAHTPFVAEAEIEIDEDDLDGRFLIALLVGLRLPNDAPESAEPGKHSANSGRTSSDRNTPSRAPPAC